MVNPSALEMMRRSAGLSEATGGKIAGVPSTGGAIHGVPSTGGDIVGLPGSGGMVDLPVNRGEKYADKLMEQLNKKIVDI